VGGRVCGGVSEGMSGQESEWAEKCVSKWVRE
jgi:hypothetical protein